MPRPQSPQARNHTARTDPREEKQIAHVGANKIGGFAHSAVGYENTQQKHQTLTPPTTRPARPPRPTITINLP